MVAIAVSSRSAASSRRPTVSLIDLLSSSRRKQQGLECFISYTSLPNFLDVGSGTVRKTHFSTRGARTNPLPTIIPASPEKRRPQSPVPFRPSASLSPTSSTAVNPPLTTLPATLNLPQKNANEPSSQFNYYISLGRAYFSFYKTGLKNVYQNFRASIPIRRSLGLPILIPTSPPPSTDLSNPSKYLRLLSRSDFQLLRRSAHDVRRMIPFAIILVICGEMTPLVALALGYSVTPLTCRTPKQVDKERLKRLKRTQRALEGLPSSPSSGDLLRATSIPSDLTVAIKEASAENILRACVVFGLSRVHAFPLPLPAPLVSTIVNQIYRPRLRRWLGYLELDDRLIVKGAGSKGMTAEEVQVAVEERGGIHIGVGLSAAEADRARRKWLKTWLDNGQET